VFESKRTIFDLNLRRWYVTHSAIVRNYEVEKKSPVISLSLKCLTDFDEAWNYSGFNAQPSHVINKEGSFADTPFQKQAIAILFWKKWKSWNNLVLKCIVIVHDFKKKLLLWSNDQSISGWESEVPGFKPWRAASSQHLTLGCKK